MRHMSVFCNLKCVCKRALKKWSFINFDKKILNLRAAWTFLLWLLIKTLEASLMKIHQTKIWKSHVLKTRLNEVNIFMKEVDDEERWVSICGCHELIRPLTWHLHRQGGLVWSRAWVSYPPLPATKFQHFNQELSQDIWQERIC